MKKAKNILLLTASLAGMLTLTSCNGETYSDKEFTYNTYLSTKPGTWNVHDWETSDESYITSFTEMGFYDVILDENKTNYKFVSEMASDFPIKVTIGAENPDGSQPEHDIGIDEIDAVRDSYYDGGNPTDGMIWDIKLNQNARWQDGTPIKADDYVQSLERQLSPKFVNFRADSYYSSTLVVANAERYFKSNRETIEPLYNYVNHDTFDFINSQHAATAGSNYYINFAKVAPIAAELFADGDSVTLFQLLDQDYASRHTQESKEAVRRIKESGQYYLLHHTDDEFKQRSDNHEDWAKAETPNDVKSEMMNFDIPVIDYDRKEVKVRKTTESSWGDDSQLQRYSRNDLIKDIRTFMSVIMRKNHINSERGLLSGNIKNEAFDSFDKVGIKKVDDYTIRLYLTKTIKLLDLKFALSSNWLVKVDLYDKLVQQVSGNLYTSRYASRSVENYCSYGPYKLTKYEEGKSFLIEKNNEWYGYTDGQHENQFQMTRVKTTIIENHETARGLFEKGELDDLTLDANDMRDYGNSQRLQIAPESYTQKISFNSDRNRLLSRQASGNNINKVILANSDFRKGLSLSLNRNDFASSTTAGSKAFTGLLNDLYLTDVAVGEMYTRTDQAKGIYNDVYGKLGGDPYAEDYQVTALESTAQGYNFQQATYYVEKALETELTAGNIKSGDTIDIEMQVYDTDSVTTQNMTRFISDAFTRVIAAAVAKYNTRTSQNVQIGFHLSVVKNEDYYNSAKSGNYDMIFSIWGGAAINPYGLMQVYCDPEFESTCEFGFKGKQDYAANSFGIDLNGDGTIDEKTEFKTYYGWYQDIVNNVIEDDIEDIDRTIKFDDQTEENKARLVKYKEVHDKRVTILAKLEAAILNRFEAIPLVARGSSSLYSLKVQYGSSSYINLVGYGGVRFMTFNYNDKTWNEYIKSKGYSANLYR